MTRRYATSGVILTDLYDVLKPFFVGKINGTVYKYDSRPLNSTLEDAILLFGDGDASQIQSGHLHVNVYVPDIDNNSGAKVPNTKRLDAIQLYGDDIIELLNSTYDNYLFALGKATDTYAETNIEEHFVGFFISFQLVNV